VYQISGQLDNAFAFYDKFCCLPKRKKKTKQKKTEETKPIFGGSYLENAWCDLTK